MILSLFNLSVVLAATSSIISDKKDDVHSSVSNGSSTAFQTITFSANAQAVSTISAPGKTIVTVTVTSTAKCSPTTTATVTTSKAPNTPKKETLCVKCYDKIVNTSDCRKCSMTCDDGTKVDSVDPKQNTCPNTNIKDVPCPCKDQEGHVIPENYYKASSFTGKSPLIEQSGNINN